VRPWETARLLSVTSIVTLELGSVMEVRALWSLTCWAKRG